jgi:hypothetical protein
VCGLVLDTVTHSRRELKRLAYLEIPAPQWPVSLQAGRGLFKPAAQAMQPIVAKRPRYLNVITS